MKMAAHHFRPSVGGPSQPVGIHLPGIPCSFSLEVVIFPAQQLLLSRKWVCLTRGQPKQAARPFSSSGL
ncbi:unnamed protein product [Victoria cruziana]